MDIKNTGTTTIGIVCKDGIILAADRRVTLGGHIVVNKKFQKIVTISNNIAVTTAGSVSDIQLLIKIVKAQLQLNYMRSGKESSVKETANLLASLVYGSIRRLSMIPSITGFIVGGSDDTGHYLFNLGVSGDIIESTDYEADGSGFMFATGVLESSYKKDMTINEGIKLAVKSVNAALQRDAATGNGIDVVVINKDGVKKVFEKEIDMTISV